MWNAYQVYDVECVSKIKSILLVIFHLIYGAVCLKLTQFFVMIVRICTLANYVSVVFH